MRSTVHMAVRDAFAEKLQASPALADGRVEEQRELSLPQGVACAIHVFRDDSDPTPTGIYGAPVDWSTTLRVLCKARAVAGVTAERLADSLAADVFARVMADPSLGGVADDVTPGRMSWDQDEADTAVAVATQSFVVLHRTQSQSIYS